MNLLADFTPAAAAGAAVAALGVPLLIHLLFRKRYQIVPWAAIRFLVSAERRHRRRIDQWLLLLLRAMVLLLPLLAMFAVTAPAERLWQRIKPGALQTLSNVPRSHHVLVVDASLSMTARTEDGRTRFEHAIEKAEALVRNANPGDGFTLIAFTGTAVSIVPRPSNEPEKVLAELRRLKVTHTPGDIGPALQLAATAVGDSSRTTYPRRQVTFFTDLQRSTWARALLESDGKLPEAWKKIVEEGKSDVVVLDLAKADAENLAITDLLLFDPLPLVDSPAVVNVSVQNFGRTERRRVRVELLLGRPSASGADALARVDFVKTIDTLPPGGRATVTFVLEGPNRFRERGLHVLQAGLVKDDSFPGDDLPADDLRYLAFDVRDGLHVALIDGRPAVDPSRRGSSHVSWALHPPGVSLTETPARLFRPGAQASENPEDRWVISPNELNDPALGDLTGADCVFLLDVANPTPNLVAKLESHLRRGGGLIIGLGPNAAASRDRYNALLFNEGHGILPGQLTEVVSERTDQPGYRLAPGEEDSFQRPPLAAFQADNARAGLATVPFHSYLRMDAPSDGPARRVLNFVPAMVPAEARKPDPAIIEWPRHHGRVIVFTGAFHLDDEWSAWPKLPSYLPFMHQLLRRAAANPDRHTVHVGDVIEEFFPITTNERTAGLSGPDGTSGVLPLLVQDEAKVARHADTLLSGFYRVGLGGNRDRVFAVNVPEMSSAGGSESDLRRVDATELKEIGSIQVVRDPGDVKLDAAGESIAITLKPKPWGPSIARVAMLLAIALLVVELLVAWRFGPGRTASGATMRHPERAWWVRLLSNAFACVPLFLAGSVLFVLVHAEHTGNLFGFLPDGVRHRIEEEVGVPTAAPGEGTSWRLEWFTTFVRTGSLARAGTADRASGLDMLTRLLLLVGSVALVIVAYISERRAAGGISRLVLPALLRSSAFALALFALLPQLQLAFDREGWPEVVILLDTSASMASEDDIKDPSVHARVEELLAGTNLSKADRLKLAQLLLSRKEADWLDFLLTKKKVKVAVYAMDRDTRRIATAYDPGDITRTRESLLALKPNGNESRLGDGVQAVLRDYRGGSLAGIIVLSDGVTTAGNDLPTAAHEAARAGVPLYLIGTGDSWEAPDLALTDLQVEDVVTRGDQLVFAARLTARGQVPPGAANVILCEQRDDPNTEPQRPGDPGVLAFATVALDSQGNPVPVRLGYTPTVAGTKSFVLKVAPVPDEVLLTNNRIERSVKVTEARRVRVLYLEGRPRYDFRFVKVLLERESERVAGNKSFDIRVYLHGASSGWPEVDKSALADFPTRDQLFEYDVVIYGDLDPKQLPRGVRAMQDLADFVKIRGGGLLVLSGEHAGPASFTDTPLAEILPVIATEGATKPTSEVHPLTDGYRPKLTLAGQRHPMFRFRPDEAESSQVWNRLQPLFWSARGYRRKPASEVLAVHPERSAEGPPMAGRQENHPLVLQQFVGAGRVVFLGLDDTWRWRFRDDEESFNRFWIQAVRMLARARLGRIELRTDQQVPYREGDRLVLTARFPDDSPPPADSQAVRVLMQRTPLVGPNGQPGLGDSETIVVTLTRLRTDDAERKPEDPRTFQAVLTRTPVGEYRFVLTEPDVEPDEPPRVRAQVLPPPDERSRVELNKPDLAAAATISNGGFYTLADAERVLADLKNLDPVVLDQPCPPVRLWNQVPVFALWLFVLTAEWLLRKRERLL